MIIKNEVFETVDYKDIPAEMHYKIYPLLILLKRKINQFQDITKYMCRLVMDGLKAKVGIDVFDTYAPVIDISTLILLISLAFGNK